MLLLLEDANLIHVFLFLVFFLSSGTFFFHGMIFKSSSNSKTVFSTIISGNFLVLFRRQCLFPNHKFFLHVEESSLFLTLLDPLYLLTDFSHAWVEILGREAGYTSSSLFFLVVSSLKCIYTTLLLSSFEAARGSS